MENFVKLSKNEMKMVVGGYVPAEHTCSNNGEQYPCSGTTTSCAIECSDLYGTKCGGCS